MTIYMFLLFVFFTFLNPSFFNQKKTDVSEFSTTVMSVIKKGADKFNLDFEQSLSGPENTWVVLNDGFKVLMDTTEKVKGKNSYKFTRTYLATEYELCLFQKIMLPQPGKEIEISLFSKSDQLESAWLKVVGFNKYMVKVISDSINIKNDSQWQEFSAKLTNDEKIYMVSLDIRARETFKTKKRLVSFWIDNISINIDNQAITTLSSKPVEFSETDVNEIKNNIPLNCKLEITLEKLSEISNNKVIGFGETVHGSKEIHQAVFNNIKQLIGNFNCRLVLLEIPIETGLLLNQFVNEDVITDIQLDTIVSGFAVDTNTFITFIKWVKLFNQNTENKVVIFGIDDYVNQDRPKTINKFILNKRIDSPVADSFLTVINKTYLRSKHLKFAEDNANRLATLLGKKDYLMLLQNLRIRTDTLCRLSPTWHDWKYLHRDYLMWQNTKFAIEQLSDSNTIVALWAHFSHLNKNTPSMFNEFNSLGHYLTSYFKDDYFLIGFLIGSGEVLTWELNSKTMNIKKVGNPSSQSLEYLCSLSKENNFLKLISEISDSSCMLRNIGAVLHENSQFKPMHLKGSMNGFIFIANSTAADIFNVNIK